MNKSVARFQAPRKQDSPIWQYLVVFEEDEWQLFECDMSDKFLGHKTRQRQAKSACNSFRDVRNELLKSRTKLHIDEV